jgi:two-component system NtrC family sensor kinase
LNITTDIKTEHSRQLEKLNAEVLELRRLLRQLQRMASVGAMTAMIAHELNNILTPIINYAQLAKKNPDFTNKAITRAADGGLRASEICSAILGLTHNDPVELERISLKVLLKKTLVAMGRDFSKDGIELVLNIPENVEILTRKVELQQVFMNLLINARTAVLPRNNLRRIEVSASAEDQVVTICVIDNGTGIDPENIERIFETFFTTKDEQDDEDKQDQGHGLGLALCREIVESLGGNISVKSPDHKGAAFTINLPR